MKRDEMKKMTRSCSGNQKGIGIGGTKSKLIELKVIQMKKMIGNQKTIGIAHGGTGRRQGLRRR